MKTHKMTRAQALAGGWPRYYTGEPCKRGHLSQRWTVSGACIACEESRREAEAELYRKAAARSQEEGPSDA